MSADDASELLSKTGLVFADVVTAKAAIDEFLRRFPQLPAARDVRITQQCLRALGPVYLYSDKGSDWPSYWDCLDVAEACIDGLPKTLANGLCSTARIADASKRADAITFLDGLCAANAALLRPAFDAAQDECRELMPHGKVRAQTEGLTYAKAMRDLKLHEASLAAGALDAALKGFEWHKSMNPMSARTRVDLANALSLRQQHELAVREALFGFSVDPRSGLATGTLVTLLLGFGLYAAALEVLAHHQAVAPGPLHPLLCGARNLCQGVLAATLTNVTHCGPEHCDDAVDDVVVIHTLEPRPWLALPKPVHDPLEVARVFISYRHRGATDMATRLERALKGRHAGMEVFRDETVLHGGEDYASKLRGEIIGADIVLALVDDGWAERLRQPEDVLAREITVALESGRHVIPLLLDGAAMPTVEQLPSALVTFSRLHALPLRGATFEADLCDLEVDMTQAVLDAEIQREASMAQLERLAKLEDKDSETAQRITEQLKDGMRRVIPGHSLSGEGVPVDNVVIGGDWECTAAAPGLNTTLHLHFTAEDNDSQAVRGRTWHVGRGLMGLFRLEQKSFEGRWVPFEDIEKRLLMGLWLDVVCEDGTTMKLAIPFHRRLGGKLTGTNANGLVFMSCNVRPRPAGL